MGKSVSRRHDLHDNQLLLWTSSPLMLASARLICVARPVPSPPPADVVRAKSATTFVVDSSRAFQVCGGASASHCSLVSRRIALQPLFGMPRQRTLSSSASVLDPSPSSSTPSSSTQSSSERSSDPADSPDRSSSARDRRPGGLLWVFPLITFFLGAWQVYRWKRKQRMIADRTARVHAGSPVRLNDALVGDANVTGDDAVPQQVALPGTDDRSMAALRAVLDRSVLDVLAEGSATDAGEALNARLDFHKVIVRGRFINELEMFLGPRSFSGETGVQVVTPFELSDDPKRRLILVNRGFLPNSLVKNAEHRRALTHHDEELEVAGLLRRQQTKPPSGWTPSNVPAQNQWFWLDSRAMCRELPLCGALPVVVDMLDAGPSSGWPRGGQTPISMPNNHVVYILVWWGMTGGVIWLLRHGRH